jgi:cell fate (sporulation/competence/biofilm development) regulator YlbF (YheA/YmcA/DUF963 family)
MVNIYDNANELAAALKRTEQVQEYNKVKEEVFAEESNRKMISDYKKLQFEAQGRLLAGEEPPAELMEKMRKMGEVLQFDPRIAEFFAAEYKLQTLVMELYKIIFAEVGDMTGGMFEE